MTSQIVTDWKARWKAAKTNGCSRSPDLWMKRACNRHDRHYDTHHHRDGRPITRAESDWELLKDARKALPYKTYDTPPSIVNTVPRLVEMGRNAILRNTIPVFYWMMTRTFGQKYWGPDDEIEQAAPDAALPHESGQQVTGQKVSQ